MKQLFEASGGTCKALVMMKKGTACAVFDSAEEAQMAIAIVNGTDFGGSTLEVDEWTTK